MAARQARTPPPSLDPERQAWRDRSLARARAARANGHRFATICCR